MKFASQQPTAAVNDLPYLECTQHRRGQMEKLAEQTQGRKGLVARTGGRVPYGRANGKVQVGDMKHSRRLSDPRNARWTERPNGTQDGIDTDLAGIPIHGIDQNGVPICARAIHGGICYSTNRYPNGRCIRHGGKAGKPTKNVLSPERLKMLGVGPRYAGSMTPEQAVKFAELTHMENQLSMAPDIAFADTLTEDEVGDLVATLDPLRLSELEASYDDCLSRVEVATTLFDELIHYRNFLEAVGQLLERGISTEAKKKRILEYQQHRRSLVETERRKIEMDRNMMSREEAATLLVSFAETLIRRVSEPKWFERGQGSLIRAVTLDMDRMLLGMQSPLAQLVLSGLSIPDAEEALIAKISGPIPESLRDAQARVEAKANGTWVEPELVSEDDDDIESVGDSLPEEAPFR